MTTAQKKILKQYKREIRILFPTYTHREKRFFADISNTIDEYAIDHSEFTKKELLRDIGEPKDIVSRYILDIDADILRKSLSQTRSVRIASAIVVLIALIAGSFKIGTDYLSFIEARDAYIHREETIIREYIEKDTENETDISEKKENTQDESEDNTNEEIN